MSSRFSMGQRVGWLVAFYLGWSVMLVGFQISGASMGTLIAVAATGTGLTLIGGLRLARSVDAALHTGLESRLEMGLHQMQAAAAHMAQATTDTGELSAQAAEVAQLAEELLQLAAIGRGRSDARDFTPAQSEPAGSMAGGRGKSNGATDDISDFWELSNPH